MIFFLLIFMSLYNMNNSILYTIKTENNTNNNMLVSSVIFCNNTQLPLFLFPKTKYWYKHNNLNLNLTLTTKNNYRVVNDRSIVQFYTLDCIKFYLYSSNLHHKYHFYSEIDLKNDTQSLVYTTFNGIQYNVIFEKLFYLNKLNITLFYNLQ